MENNWLWSISEIEKLRKSLGVPLFDISRLGWNPDFDILEGYTRNLYEKLVSKYKEIERTHQYHATRNVLIATGVYSERDLAFSAGGGSTVCEAACTHGMGWALKGLTDKAKTYREPFNFKLFAIGYSPRDDSGENLELIRRCA